LGWEEPDFHPLNQRYTNQGHGECASLAMFYPGDPCQIGHDKPDTSLQAVKCDALKKRPSMMLMLQSYILQFIPNSKK
jgi:hypothetical protein